MAGLLVVEERSGFFEGVTGHLPLEREAPHEVGAGERPFPEDAAGSESENETVALVSDGEFLGVRVKTEALPFRIKIAVWNIKAAHDVAITIDLPSAHRIEMIKGDIDIAPAKGLVETPEVRLDFE